MAMKTLHDLFEHELKDIYDAELKLVDALQEQAAESSDPQIRASFQKHQKETERQTERLDGVFDIWGREATRGKGCAGIDGLIEEHKAFKQEKPAAAILDAFNLTAAAKVERYEITAYESLIRLAEQMGLDDAVELLHDNLLEEEATLEKVLDMAEEVGPRIGARVEAPRRAVAVPRGASRRTPPSPRSTRGAGGATRRRR